MFDWLIDCQIQDRASDSSQAADGASSVHLVLSPFFSGVRDRIQSQGRV